MWSLDEEASRPLIKQALEAGINFFDTANMYSQGSSEEIVGRALKDFADRDEVVIATKVRHRCARARTAPGLSRKAIFAEIDHSLRRLGTDYVDLYQIHRLDHATPIEETLEALHDVVQGRQGALSRRLVDARLGVRQGAALAARARLERFVSMQDHYNLLAREEEREMLPLCVDEGVGDDRRGARWPAAGSPGPGASRPDGRQSDPFADMLYTDEASDRAIVEAVAKSPKAPRRQPGRRSRWRGCGESGRRRADRRREQDRLTSTTPSLRSTIELTGRGGPRLEAPYTPRYDFQGISDGAELARISARIGIRPAGA